MSMEQLTLWSEEAPARVSASPEEERAWKESLLCASSIGELYATFARRGFSGRTSPEYFPPETTLSDSFSGKWKNSGMAWHGERLTLSSSEWPSDAAVCSLSDTLETGGVPQRYSLTPKACAGILSRAERRGKSLPEPLASVLQAVASSSTREQERGGVGYEREQSPTLTADWHNPAVMAFDTTQVADPRNGSNPNDCAPCHTINANAHVPAIALQTDHMCQNGTNVSEEVCKTLDVASATPVVCVADDNSNAATDVDMCGSLKVGGGVPWIASR